MKLLSSIGVLLVALVAGIRASWQYFPDTLQNAWKVGPLYAIAPLLLLVLVLGGTSLWYRLADHSIYESRQAAKAPPTQRQRVDILVEKGYDERGAVDLPNGQKAFVLSRKSDDSKDDLAVFEQTIIGEDAESKMRTVVLYDGASWKELSSTHVTAAGVDNTIEEALQADLVASAFVDAAEVYCFGLASTEKVDEDSRAQKVSENEKLASDRAQKLCLSIAQLGYVDVTERRVWAVPLGAALDVAANEQSTARQRAAVIVSIPEVYHDFSLDVFVDAVAMATEDLSVPLDRYSRSRLSQLDDNEIMARLKWIEDGGVESHHWQWYDIDRREHRYSISWRHELEEPDAAVAAEGSN